MVNILSLSEGLSRREDGIWYGPDKQSVSFPEDGNQSCFQLEEDSFWFKHRNNCITSLVKLFPPKTGEAIFDIGGGNGFVSLGLQRENFAVVLMEPGAEGASNAKSRGIEHVICGTTKSANIKRASLPAVGLFDVIEHIEDDSAFMTSIADILKDDGRLYATVPAYQFLWSDEDSTGGHFRRYTLSSFCQLIERSGFTIDFSTYFFRFLPPAIFASRVIPYRLGLSKSGPSDKSTQRDHAVEGGFLAAAHNLLLESEIKNINNQNAMIFGGSCLVAATKCAPK